MCCFCSFFFLCLVEGTDADSLDDDGSLSLGDDCSDCSSSEESLSDPDIQTILQQRRGKKRVLSESPIKAPDHLERSYLEKKLKERYRTGIAHVQIVVAPASPFARKGAGWRDYSKLLFWYW